MKYRKLGLTGLDVSVLSLGGSSLGSVFEPIDESQGVRTVHTALDHGINLIDTAPFYGLTKAEGVLGKALREIARDRYLLATKVGRYGFKMESFDFSADRVRKSVDESLARLGVDYIDFIQVHDIEFGDINLIVKETLPALRAIQATGKVRFIGITCLPVRLFRQVMDRADVDQVQSYCHYCLNDDALVDQLPYFHDKGVAVFNAAPIAMRMLSSQGPPDWHPAPEQLRIKCAEAARYCADRKVELGKLALQFSVSHPGIQTTIIGTADPRRIAQGIRDIEEPLDKELLRDVLGILRPVHNLTWISGRPENNLS